MRRPPLVPGAEGKGAQGPLMSWLEGIHSPADVKALSPAQLEELCAEIRQFLIRNVSETGGHLSSNLGTVELTVALHHEFSSPTDSIIFDVGHQCYTHKILTGRSALFGGLRRENGLSGFPCPQESPHDPFVEGHANVALSQAIGHAQAKKLRGEPGYVIAVMGDGAFTGGMVYEGINNIARLDNLIVILNDNKMSISKNVGAISRYFTRLRTDAGYNRAKRNVQSFLRRVPLVGPAVARGLVWAKGLVRRLIYRSTWFEDMGFAYHGPLDGHDLHRLCEAFANLKGLDRPLFLHIVTIKGKGFAPAEENPGAFHGVPSFDVNSVPVLDPDLSPGNSFSDEFGRALCAAAAQDTRICAVTAAMKYGTGLHYMRKAFPARIFDVGMAEQHAVTFAAGLARGGMRPVVAIYSTFLQRAYDQIIHDVALNHADVLLAIDRAGLVPGDGVTHQGIYDVAFLSQLSEMQIVSPANYAELRFWLLRLLQEESGPRALRYSRGEPTPRLEALGCTGRPYDFVSRASADTVLVSYGTLFDECLQAQQQAQRPPALLKLTVLHPLPPQLAQELCAYQTIVFAEESVPVGSVGQQLSEQLAQAGFRGQLRHLTVSNIVDHATVAQLRRQQGLDAAGILRTLRQAQTETTGGSH